MWKFVFPFLAALFAVGVGSMTGGFKDVNSNDEGVQNALSFAVSQYNRANNDLYMHRATKVLKAQSQVVAGVKYIITAEMAKTTCRKTSATDECPIETGPNMAYTCTFTVWSRLWLSDIRLLNAKC